MSLYEELYQLLGEGDETHLSPKVLFFDIETAPNLAYVWGQWEQNVIDHVQEWYILCFAYKWQGEKKIHHSAQIDYLEDFIEPADDYGVTCDLWRVLDEADIVIAHNGDRFDVKKANARFAYHNLPAPSPYRTLDTRKIAAGKFAFNSNKLDNLGHHLGLGRKVKHDGFEMWKGCMAGDEKAWAKMIKYNKQDIKLLEEVYERLRPWVSGHPNMAVWGGHACPHCGAERDRLQKRGHYYTQTYVYDRYFCTECSSWSRQRQSTPVHGEPPEHVSVVRR